VTRMGGAVYVLTRSAWSLYEGHCKIFSVAFLPRPLATLGRLTAARLTRTFRRAGLRRQEWDARDPARETVGPLRGVAAGWYALMRATLFIEVAARKT